MKSLVFAFLAIFVFLAIFSLFALFASLCIYQTTISNFASFDNSIDNSFSEKMHQIMNQSITNDLRKFDNFDVSRIMNWYNNNSSTSLLVVISNNSYKIYNNVTEKGYIKSANDFKTMMARLSKYKLPDCTFVQFLGDRDITHDLPIFHNSTLTYVKGILSPLWYYTIKAQLDKLIKSPKVPWSNKISKAIWRGSNTGDSLNHFRVGYRISRRYVVDTSIQYPELVDAKFTNFTSDNNLNVYYEKYPNLPPLEQCKYKYIISMDGNGGTYGLYWTLSSGSCCLNNFKYRQWFSPFFEDNKHYISFDDSAENSNLNFAVEDLRNNDEVAEMIASTSKKTAEIVFDEKFVLEYMLKLLQSYSVVQNSLPPISSINIITPDLKYQ